MNDRLDPTDDDIRCPDCKKDEIIGVEVWGLHGGPLYWECLACRYVWHRWPQGHHLHRRAKSYVYGRARVEPAGRTTVML